MKVIRNEVKRQWLESVLTKSLIIFRVPSVERGRRQEPETVLMSSCWDGFHGGEVARRGSVSLLTLAMCTATAFMWLLENQNPLLRSVSRLTIWKLPVNQGCEAACPSPPTATFLLQQTKMPKAFRSRSSAILLIPCSASEDLFLLLAAGSPLMADIR